MSSNSSTLMTCHMNCSSIICCQPPHLYGMAGSQSLPQYWHQVACPSGTTITARANHRICMTWPVAVVIAARGLVGNQPHNNLSCRNRCGNRIGRNAQSLPLQTEHFSRTHSPTSHPSLLRLGICCSPSGAAPLCIQCHLLFLLAVLTSALHPSVWQSRVARFMLLLWREKSTVQATML